MGWATSGYTPNRLPYRYLIARDVLATSAAITQSTAGALTGQSPTIIDLEDCENCHEGNLAFEVKTTNGQGGTPTSPGAAVTLTFYYGFTNFPIAAADVPTICASTADLKQFTVTLPNTNSFAAAGQRVWKHATAPIVPVSGRYAFYWYDKQAFAANAAVLIEPRFVRVN